jgi:hypothetical protein
MYKRTVERMVTKINQGMIDLGDHRGGAHFVTKDKTKGLHESKRVLKKEDHGQFGN